MLYPSAAKAGPSRTSWRPLAHCQPLRYCPAEDPDGRMKAARVIVSVVVAWASGCTRGDGIDRTLVTGASAGSVHAEGTHGREWSRLYGASMVDKFRRAATNMDRIVKGAKPADLPVDQPTDVYRRPGPRRAHHSARRRSAAGPCGEPSRACRYPWLRHWSSIASAEGLSGKLG